MATSKTVETGIKMKNIYEERAKIMKALAHPTRLFIIDQLSQEEKCVCDLTKMVGADQSTISKHLSILKQVGIISNSKNGTSNFYRLKMPCILNYFKCVDEVFKSDIKERTALLK